MKHILHFTKQIHSFSGKVLYYNLIAMIFIGLLEGVGILLLIPLISLTGILDLNIEASSPLYKFNGIFQDIPETISLILILFIYVLLIIGIGFFQRNQTILNVKIQQGFTLHLKEKTYRSLLQANWGFFLKRRKSDIINTMTKEISRVSSGTNLFLQFISSLVFTIIQICIALWLSPFLTITVMFLGFALIYLSKSFVKKSNNLGKETIELSQNFLAGITDHFNGIKDIKSNNLEESHIVWFRSVSQRMLDNGLELVKLKTTSQLLYKIISAFLVAFFVFISIKMFQAQPAQLMLIIIIFTRLWPRFSGIQSNLEQLGSIVPSFKVLVDLQNVSLEAKEYDEENNVKPIQIKKGVECREVNFRYNINEPVFALKDINIHIPSNQMTAIVGHSGAGKSTLIDLLMGLNKHETGEILIDGTLLTEDNLLSMRRSISYVSQDPFLFNATVRENLLLIEPDAGENQIWEALKFASADEFVKKLPKGLDTLIGDRGVRLSGGERQRIVLARAILRKPSILVLDEATSALDTENEYKIQQALEQLKGNMTVIVIAHRLSTIRHADQIIVLDKGNIIQQGSYSQLANEKRGMFSNLLGKQLEMVK
ncbi:ABC transporter ATP-binding protein [Cytobacillus sp. S13-E01]|uniref:ABC transporter ATP-binding protein n=1 Tax=Cytobacillus sp. S13-E01 TaxID=3031326 RepID=UPI0023D8BADE|nr:ABC transporter ATP-binding protein [Cytobacillus sp. S13-E01]MDF0727750.1 ABC transporter ATP-binding protein [Cytobacillus sp. S13-E01]